MDTFTAIPSFQRFPIKIVDQERLHDWMESEEIDQPIPTVTKIFVGYEKGSGTPVPVQIEVDQIETEYIENLPTDEESKTLSASQYADKWRRVNMLLRRNLLLAVIRGLDPDSANMLAHEDAQGREILERLGWITRRPLEQEQEQEQEPEKESENKTEGEVEVVNETGE